MLSVKKLLHKILTGLSPLVTNEGWMNVYGNYCQAKRRGKVVTVVGYSAGGGIALVAGDYKNITTLPSQFRPTHATYFSATANGGTQTIFGTIDPSTGLVRLYSNGVTSYWSYCVTYLID